MLQLLSTLGVATPVISSLLSVIVKKWVDSLPTDYSSRYVEVIRTAKKSGNYLRRKVYGLLRDVDAEGRVFVISLFAASLLSELLQPLEAEEADEGQN